MVFWTVGAVAGLLIAIAAPFIAYNWVKPGILTEDTVRRAIVFMGVAVAVQWPSMLYSSGLIGLQRQELLNVVNVAGGTLRAAGAVAILWWVAPTVEAFFVWSIVALGVVTLVQGICLWRILPRTGVVFAGPDFHSCDRWAVLPPE